METLRDTWAFRVLGAEVEAVIFVRPSSFLLTTVREGPNYCARRSSLPCAKVRLWLIIRSRIHFPGFPGHPNRPVVDARAIPARPAGSLRDRGHPADLLVQILQAVRSGLECGELSPQYATQRGHVRRMRPAWSAVTAGLSSSVVSGSNPVASMNRGASPWPLGCRRKRPRPHLMGASGILVAQCGSGPLAARSYVKNVCTSLS